MKTIENQSFGVFTTKNKKPKLNLSSIIKPQKNYMGYNKKSELKKNRFLKDRIKSYKKFFRLYYKYIKNYLRFNNLNLKDKLRVNKSVLKKQEETLNNSIKNLKKPKALQHGILRVFYKKRNIFLVLSDFLGKTYASTSTGTLVKKKKKYIPSYVVKDTARKIISKLFLLKLPQLRKIVFVFKGKQHRKTKSALVDPFQKHKKLKILTIIKLSFRSHNGCRPPKTRRK